MLPQGLLRCPHHFLLLPPHLPLFGTAVSYCAMMPPCGLEVTKSTFPACDWAADSASPLPCKCLLTRHCKPRCWGCTDAFLSCRYDPSTPAAGRECLPGEGRRGRRTICRSTCVERGAIFLWHVFCILRGSVKANQICTWSAHARRFEHRSLRHCIAAKVCSESMLTSLAFL